MGGFGDLGVGFFDKFRGLEDGWVWIGSGVGCDGVWCGGCLFREFEVGWNLCGVGFFEMIWWIMWLWV